MFHRERSWSEADGPRGRRPVIIRVLVLSYLPLFIVSNGLANLTGQMMLRGLVLVPAALFVAGCVLTRLTVPTSLPPFRFGRLTTLVIIFSLVYSLLYFPRAFTGSTAIGGLPSLPTHALFTALVVRSHPYRKDVGLFVYDFCISAIVTIAIGVADALNTVGWRVAAGAVHDLDRLSNFVRSDLDVPLLSLMLAVAGATALHARLLARPQPRAQLSFGKAAALFLFGTTILLFYSRRTPVLALLGALAVLLVPRKLVARLSYAGAALPLLPLFWGMVVTALLFLTQNEIVGSLLPRNDVQDYVTGSNRVSTWLKSLLFISRWQNGHWLGYGDAPSWILPQHLGWLHVHNAYMQLFFETGILGLTLGVAMVLATLHRLSKVLREQANPLPRGILNFLLGWCLLAAVEPSFRSYSIVHLLVLTTAIVVDRLPVKPVGDERSALPSRGGSDVGLT